MSIKVNDDGYTYAQWLKAADKACVRISGVGIESLPDGPSRYAFEDGVPPEEYAIEQLEEEGFPFE